MTYHIDPDIFFKIHQGELILWNYREHKQYQVERDHLQRILEIASNGGANFNHPVDKDLKDAGLIHSGEAKARAWGWDALSEIFHVGTSRNLSETKSAASPNETYEGYLKRCEAIADRMPASPFVSALGPPVKLPAADLSILRDSSLWEAMVKRKTSRNLNYQSVSLEGVATLLYSTFGAVHGPDRSDVEHQGLTSFGYRRTSPSAGSLQCIDAYLIAFSVDGLKSGAYQYRADAHELCVIQDKADRDQFSALLCNQDFARPLAFAIALVARFDRLWWKYDHSRAYRVAYLDAGHLSQTFLLGATALNLNTWLTGFFFDESLNQFLKLRDKSESTLFVVGAGHGAGDAVSPGDLEAARKMMENF